MMTVGIGHICMTALQVSGMNLERVGKNGRNDSSPPRSGGGTKIARGGSDLPSSFCPLPAVPPHWWALTPEITSLLALIDGVRAKGRLI